MAKVDFDWVDTSILFGADWTRESVEDVLIKLNLRGSEGVENSKGLGCDIRTYTLPDYETDEEEQVKLWVVWSLAKYGLEGPSEAEILKEWIAITSEVF